MRRVVSAAGLAALGLAVLAGLAAAAGPPFPTPVAGRSVYDQPGALTPATVSHLQREIDLIESRSGAQIVIYLQVDPSATEASNLDAARALIDQWGIGRRGFDDGLVLLLGLQPDLKHGRVSLASGSGFNGAYLNENQLKQIIDQDFVPAAKVGDLDSAVSATLAAVDRGITPGGRERLDRARLIDAILGLVLAPIALLVTIAVAYLSWRRQGRDPFFLDSPSVLMAGPPADLTPPLATVVRNGHSDQRSLTTALVELASQGWIAFQDVDAPVVDNQGGPTIAVADADPPHARHLPKPEGYLLDALRGMAGSLGFLDREALSGLHESIGDFHQLLEADAVRLGWFHEQPRRAIARWLVVATLEMVAGGGGLVAGFVVPTAGLVALGAALVVGGLVTLGFALAMSQRTPNGAMVDGMLKAYRRTLVLTLAQSRSMEQVVADQTVRILATTPDEAVVWGIALGLHKEVAAVLERSLEDRRAGTAPRASTWYPVWLGTTSALTGSGGSGASGGLVSHGGGGLFSASPIPNVAGMFSVLGSIGSPPASSGGGGGFGGGGSAGGGGASGSF